MVLHIGPPKLAPNWLRRSGSWRGGEKARAFNFVAQKLVDAAVKLIEPVFETTSPWPPPIPPNSAG